MRPALFKTVLGAVAVPPDKIGISFIEKQNKILLFFLTDPQGATVQLTEPLQDILIEYQHALLTSSCDGGDQ